MQFKANLLRREKMDLQRQYSTKKIGGNLKYINIDKADQSNNQLKMNANKQSQAHRGDKPEKAHIKLNISTWSKDSHGLYDYESSNESYKAESHKIQCNTAIYRDTNTPRTSLVAKNDPKHVKDSFYPIANVVFQKKQGKGPSAFRFEPVANNQVDPANYDTTKTFYLVIREKNPENPTSNGFVLRPGHIVKMGRVEYMIIEMKNNFDTYTIRDTNHFNQNNGIFQCIKNQSRLEQEGNQIRCKVCLCSEETVEDPLISPCQCKGTLLKIHVGCLKQWINSKVKKEINDIATSYNFTKFECQICKCPFPKIIKVENKQIEMMTISKPSKPYIILESLNRTGEMGKEERCLHLISAKENSQIRIGRGHQCEIRLTDISVSRSHAKIVFLNDEFYIRDEKSKFGTLIKFEGSHVFQPEVPLRVQYGRTVYEFELVAPPEDATDEEAEKAERQPMEPAE